MQNEIKRSPLFYVGDKYKLIKEIRYYIPKEINRLIEPFVGGGSVFMNVEAKEYVLNDINPHIVEIHEMLTYYAHNSPKDFYDFAFQTIEFYSLSCSFKGDEVPQALKDKFPKTYIAHYNKEAYLKLRADYNTATEKDPRLLYLLLIYGFNRMVRFNAKGDFNVPVGNVDFNTNTYQALENYFNIIQRRNKIKWYKQDYKEFIQQISLHEGDFIYLDPPYLITCSEYNKLWSIKEEINLYKLLDTLTESNVKWALSNVSHYKGEENTILTKWAQKYQSHSIKSNYISFRDNTIKKFNEVLVTNYL